MLMKFLAQWAKSLSRCRDLKWLSQVILLDHLIEQYHDNISRVLDRAQNESHLQRWEENEHEFFLSRLRYHESICLSLLTSLNYSRDLAWAHERIVMKDIDYEQQHRNIHRHYFSQQRWFSTLILLDISWNCLTRFDSLMRSQAFMTHFLDLY